MTFKFDGAAVINLVLILGLLGFTWKLSSDIRDVGDALRVDIAGVRAEMAELKVEMAYVSAQIAEISERLARIEGWIEGRFDDAQAPAHLPDTPASAVPHAIPNQ